MKRITIEIPDGYDDALSITAIGVPSTTKVLVTCCDLEGHDGEMLVISKDSDDKWVPIIPYMFSKICDDDSGFYE